MKKSYKGIIITIIILILILAPASIYFYNNHQETIKIQEINKAQFNFLKCISNCSIIHSGNKSAFKQSCLADCNIQSNLTKSQENKQEQLINNYEYLACTRKINMSDTMTLEKYQTCIIELLPKLQSKYDYLK